MTTTDIDIPDIHDLMPKRPTMAAGTVRCRIAAGRVADLAARGWVVINDHGDSEDEGTVLMEGTPDLEPSATGSGALEDAVLRLFEVALLKALPNNPRHEVLFATAEGLPPAQQKRLIATALELGCIDHQDARVVCGALGLAEA